MNLTDGRILTFTEIFAMRTLIKNTDSSIPHANYKRAGSLLGVVGHEKLLQSCWGDEVG